MLKAFEIAIKGIKNGSIQYVGERKGMKPKSGAGALLQSLNFIFQVMGIVKRSSVREEPNEVFLQKAVCGHMESKQQQGWRWG